ncbi:uncharacterized protein STEHIDRAFT_111622 [Stereum hirsutum FP-91666 SS1]|uniref:uncharacterized protein n=1 Tax=Stereum hirsutum (strain FP-91666) TaxID=721885 RepID=UPI000444A306|nr:uncharacterized protein STEHIDRAFT_111622 [Stereum hirsutum FP-91666 SS1]EIM86080.1 hypothetical protein STEHIDRAFT_111622 [Stereum hirsutum FP-91666 SS1]
MSTSAEILLETVLEDRVWIISNYTIVSSTAVWLLDLLQTLPMEINIVWSSKPTGTAVIFLLNRYIFGIYLIMITLFSSPGSVSDESCSALSILASSFQVVALFTTNPNIVVVALPLVLDTLVFAITLIKLYRHFLEMRGYNQRSLSGLLLRDGILYFFVVFTIAAANLAFEVNSVLNGSQTQELLSEILQPYFNLAPNLLINRLYLNLRAINHQSDTVTPEHNGMPEMAFAQDRFLGNIGAPLDPDWWNAQFDDDEGDGDELAIQDGSITPTGNNGVTTLVPVVYEGEGHGDIEMVLIQRESETPMVGPSRSVEVVA